MAPVALRRLQREQARGGLVVALALYGAEKEVVEVAKRRRQGQQAAPQQQQQQRSTQEAPQQEAGDRQQQQQGQQEVEAPPAVVDVTRAVQYMVEDSRVVFHKGGWRHGGEGSRLLGGGGGATPGRLLQLPGLMGACDPIPHPATLACFPPVLQATPSRG